MSLTSYFVEKGVSVWTQAFQKRPVITVIVSVALVAAVALGIWLIQKRESERIAEQERKRNENYSYNQQLDTLENVQVSLNNLIGFVELQKTRLRDSEDLLNKLQMQREQLQPLLQADQKTVEAILELQTKRAETAASRERWFAFIGGVISSIVASGLITLVATFIKKRRQKAPPATP